MSPATKKIIIEILKTFGKAAFTGIAYGLVSKVWRL
jgi:hypothetical protein